ncbi:MAG: hypothetical protein JXQ73_17680 [Phycisphaerae bacterium]|nr:hypothetical protein [Phycisphaerae bacterium]
MRRVAIALLKVVALVPVCVAFMLVGTRIYTLVITHMPYLGEYRPRLLALADPATGHIGLVFLFLFFLVLSRSRYWWLLEPSATGAGPDKSERADLETVVFRPPAMGDREES